MEKIKPLHDWALIEPSEADEKSAGGIYLPDVAKERPHEGKVIAIGQGRMKEEKDKEGKIKEKKFVPTTLKPGAHILYEKYMERKVELDGKEYVMVREEDILGTLD